ncbi:MAG TPA: glycosyltransferase family 4 protein [Candidatus Treponema faecavium]|nr:glycosyltransferase family 4 protein [Candidatus Treponema faecavium]
MVCFPKRILKQINRCDVYFTPYCNVPCGIRIPIYITIHDIIFPDMPELTSRLGLALRMFFYRRAYAKAQALFTVSRFSKDRIQFYLGCKKPIHVVYDAVSAYLRKQIEPPPVQRTILFVGNIKRHKGLAVLIPAFKKLRQNYPDIELLVVGSAENFRSKDEQINTYLQTGNTEGIRFTGYISDTELQTVYASSALLVQPSLYEGFGLPPLEAMYCGTPALISDIPVFKEIYDGYPVTYFTAGDSSDLYSKLHNFFSHTFPARIHLTEEQKNIYSFEKTAKNILSIFTAASYL